MRCTTPLALCVVVCLQAPAGAEERIRYSNIITMRGEEVLLDGIHCEPRGTELGEKARTFIDEMLAGLGLKTCHFTGSLEGIALGRCSFNRQDIGARLIAEGLCGRCPARDAEGEYSSIQEQAGSWKGILPADCAD